VVLEPVCCLSCNSTDVVKQGYTETGNPRYRCCNGAGSHTPLMRDYANIGWLPEMKGKVVDRALNASGIRETCRVLNVSPSTVIKILRDKGKDLESMNHGALSSIKNRDAIQVVVNRYDEAELDEMWSFVGKKSNPRGLWHAIDHTTSKILAYVFGTGKDEVFRQLPALLEPFGIGRFYSDDWGAYERHITNTEHCVGKRNTQKIERKHLTLRTRIKRLARKTICFSKPAVMHDIVIGLFINRYEFCNPV